MPSRSVILVAALFVGLSAVSSTAQADTRSAATAEHTAASGTAALWPEAYYWIKARHSGKVVTLPAGSTGNYPINLVQQGLTPTTNGHPDWQRFRPVLRKVDQYGRQWYTFHRANNSKECIRTNQETGYNLHIGPCNWSNWKYWDQIDSHYLFTAYPQSDGYWSWMGWWQNTTWDVRYGSAKDGAPILSYAPHGGVNQQFMLYKVQDAEPVNWNYSPTNSPPPAPVPTQKPDLVLTGTPSYSQTTKKITAEFTNQGNAGAGPFVVSMLIDNGVWCSVSVQSLTVGQVASITCDFTSLSPGSYNFAVNLDTFGTVAESIEGNNEYHSTFVP
ncbi:CARDB domain-containing protein [Kribbella sp. NPDC051770]|uniref:CARDB domain-containing protein n=1 Tax=Kribbella sp. NPDC051770 TaxID=3155413 RepID=UPI0034450DB1